MKFVTSSLSPILLYSIFLYVQLPVHYSTTILFPFLTPHPLIYISFLSSTLVFVPSAIHLLSILLPLPFLFPLLL